MAFDRGEITLQSKISMRLNDIVPPLDLELGDDWEEGPLPARDHAGPCPRYTKVEVAASLDALKDAGFHWATRSGVTVSIDDVTTPENKIEILSGYEAQAEKVQKQFERGLVTDEERRQELIEIWTQASNEVAKAMEANFDRSTRSS